MRQIIADGLKKDRPKIKVTSVSASYPGHDDPKKLLIFVRLSMQPLRLSYEEAQVAGLRGRWVVAWTASSRLGGPQETGLPAPPFGPVPRAMLLSGDRSTWRDTLIEGFRPSIQQGFVRPLIEPPIR